MMIALEPASPTWRGMDVEASMATGRPRSFGPADLPEPVLGFVVLWCEIVENEDNRNDSSVGSESLEHLVTHVSVMIVERSHARVGEDHRVLGHLHYVEERRVGHV